MATPRKARSQLLILEANEASFDDENLRARVTLIRPGLSGNRIEWNAAALRKASESGFWNGSRMFLDHAEKDRGLPRKPKRSIRDLVSAVESTEVMEDGRIVGTVQFFDENFYSFAKRAKEHMGVSVSLLYAGKEIKEHGKPVKYAVEELVTNNSVDWVVDPAAGGKIDSFMSASEGEDGVEWDELTADMIRQHRPDLFPASEGQSSGTSTTTQHSLSEADVQKMIRSAQEEVEEKYRVRAAVSRQFKTRVEAAGLPAKTASRIIASYDGAEKYDEAAVDADIKAAREELEDAGVKPKVRMMGASESTEGTKPTSLAEVAPTHSAMESVFSVPKKGLKSSEGDAK